MPAVAYANPPSRGQIIQQNGSDLGESFVESHLKAFLKRHGSSDEHQEESFFVADMGDVYRQFIRWTRNLKRVKPYYGTKQNLRLDLVPTDCSSC